MNVRAAALAIIIAATTGVIPVATSEAHPSITTCTYSSGTVRLRLSSEHAVRLYVLEGRISFSDLADNKANGPCGSATVQNTDAVRVTEEAPGNSRLQVDQQRGPFGPGRTLEATGISEIEIYAGTVVDVWVMGRSVRDDVALGTKGINLNRDSDTDVITSSIDEVIVFLLEGADHFTAAGGSGTGDPWSPSGRGYLVVYGHDGNDRMRGSRAGDALDGDFGADVIRGLGGDDDLRGGGQDDLIYGAGGEDVIDAGYGRDTVHAGPGADVIMALDYAVDVIDGGTSSDRATVDPDDALTSVETVRFEP